MPAKLHTWNGHSGPVLAERHGGTVIDCEVCGYKHAVPLPDPEAVKKFYAEEFFGGFHQDYIAGQRKDLPWWRLEFAAKYRLLAGLLPPDRRRLLDVGSGAGWFLQFGAEQGWDTLGVEPSRAACAHARDALGCTVVEGFFEPGAIAGLDPVDVVHLNNVLEHVPDPGAFLETARGALALGGLICITAPNDFNPLQEALIDLRGHEPWWVDPREHVNYFDGPSLEALLQRHGFAARRRLASFPLELFALMGEDYLADPDLGRVIHGRRKALEFALHEAGKADLLAGMYGKLGELGLGRTLTVIAERLD
ncbi:MAG: class I SAM-dependent methyltransferase [Candidatus Krumholzibacteriia bacterium]